VVVVVLTDVVVVVVGTRSSTVVEMGMFLGSAIADGRSRWRVDALV
jgi:hypothetical protein